MTHSFILQTEAIPSESADDLAAAARSDPEAFALLYERYLPSVYRYLRTRTATPEDASDLTQQVFLNAFRSLDRYRTGSSGFAPWLFRIARNAATDGHRRRRGAITWEALPETLTPVDDRTPEAAVLRSERLQRLRAAVAALDPTKQELLALRFAAGLSAAQIAPVAGKSEAAVKKQLTRILHTLKETHHDDLSPQER